MRNGFGLKFVHRFLNLPFLALQRDTLQGLLATNTADTQATLQELEACQESEEAHYDRSLGIILTYKKCRLYCHAI